jgi:hypothetical protein
VIAYGGGLFVHAAKRAGSVEIDRCKRPPIMLAGRGEPGGFDSGLLEAPPVKGKTFRNKPENAPRGIYPIYEKKTTGKD